MPVIYLAITQRKQRMKVARIELRMILRAWSIPLSRKLMYCEAIMRLILAWFLVRLVPYNKWRKHLGQVRTPEAVISTVHAYNDNVAMAIASVHHVLRRMFGTRFTCLMLALSARGMLKARNIQSELTLGVSRTASANESGKLGAHAWVTSGNIQIIGYDGSEGFTPVGVYHGY